MLQIKTIRTINPTDFDNRVNEAIKERWTLVRRLSGPDFIAEMERQAVPENERNCGNCLYCAQDGGEPCDSCDEDTLDAWEPGEGVVAV